MFTFLLYGAGVLLLLVAFEFYACRPSQRLIVTTHDVTNFTADIQSWLRSESR
jgi:hypothetical protein